MFKLIFNKRFLSLSLSFLFLNFLIAYLFPFNYYIYILLALTVVSIFKLAGLRSINIFIYSIPYFIIPPIIVLFRDFALSYRLLRSFSFNILSYFILIFVTYIYEEKLEKKIIYKTKKILYIFFSCFFCLSSVFLFSQLNIKEPSTIILVNNTKEIINRIFIKKDIIVK